MRYPKCLLAALAVAGAAGGGAAGCGSSGPEATPYAALANTPAPVLATGSVGGSAASVASAATGPAARRVAGHPQPVTGQRSGSGSAGTGHHSRYAPDSNGPAPGVTASGARSAAATFDALYFGGQFSRAWDLLTPTARREIPRGTWVAVHGACPAASRATVTSVTVFGTAAIVTESADTGGTTAEYVLSHSGGRWSVAPGNVSLYRHSSIAADVAAAKSAGLCAGRPDVF